MYQRKYPAQDKVVIEVEDTKFSCSRKKLCDNSDYFHAMFNGEFTEKDKKTVTIQDVPENGFKNCLNMIDNKTESLEYDQILETLQCASLLQFEEIKTYCIDRYTCDLRVYYSLDIWNITEILDIHPLCEKAKCLALIEFNKIKELNCILQINIKQLHQYLANVLIHCDCELDIFETGMKWWYENSPKFKETENWTEKDSFKYLYTIISCIDYKSMPKSYINNMITYPDIPENKEIYKILVGIKTIMEHPEAKLDDDVDAHARNLYFNSTRRDREILPCIVTSEYPWQPEQNKRTKTMERQINISYYDRKTRTMQKLYKKDVEFASKCSPSLNGCKILPYKHNLILFGGEYSYGSANWNSNIWLFQSFKNQWKMLTKMPKDRRHFTSYIIDDKLFIIGGTGKYRIKVNSEMMLYDFLTDQWTESIQLPYSWYEIRVCEYQKQLFVVPAVPDNKYGYVFCMATLSWIKLTIRFPPHFKFDFTKNFVLFSKDDYIYIKGSHFIEMQIQGTSLKIKRTENLEELHGDKLNYYLNNDKLYIFTKHDTAACDQIFQLHCFHLRTKNNELLVQINDSIDTWWHIKRGCFPFFHYSLTKEIKCISEFQNVI